MITIFDKNFNKIAPLEKYSFADYVKKYCDRGSFSIKTFGNEEEKETLKTAKYILFGTNVLGIIDEMNFETEWSISGSLISKSLSFRCFLKTKKYSGTTTNVVKQMVIDNFINPTDLSRKVLFMQIDPNDPIGDLVDMQITGDEIETAIINLLLKVDFGFELSPVLNAQNTTIEKLNFKVYKGTDRGYNEEDPEKNKVMFTRKLGNLLTATYNLNNSSFKNVAIVAGEGEGTDRQILTVGDIETFGLERVEMYVDARDLQKEIDGVIIPDAQYLLMLEDRGLKNLADHIEFINVNGTIDPNSDLFKINKDFFLGDIISIYDERSGQGVNTRITEEKHTFDGNGEKIDLVFGKQAPLKLNILKRGGKI